MCHSMQSQIPDKRLRTLLRAGCSLRSGASQAACFLCHRRSESTEFKLRQSERPFISGQWITVLPSCWDSCGDMQVPAQCAGPAKVLQEAGSQAAGWNTSKTCCSGLSPAPEQAPLRRVRGKQTQAPSRRKGTNKGKSYKRKVEKEIRAYQNATNWLSIMLLVCKTCSLTLRACKCFLSLPRRKPFKRLVRSLLPKTSVRLRMEPDAVECLQVAAEAVQLCFVCFLAFTVALRSLAVPAAGDCCGIPGKLFVGEVSTSEGHRPGDSALRAVAEAVSPREAEAASLMILLNIGDRGSHTCSLIIHQ